MKMLRSKDGCSVVIPLWRRMMTIPPPQVSMCSIIHRRMMRSRLLTRLSQKRQVPIMWLCRVGSPPQRYVRSLGAELCAGGPMRLRRAPPVPGARQRPHGRTPSPPQRALDERVDALNHDGGSWQRDLGECCQPPLHHQLQSSRSPESNG